MADSLEATLERLERERIEADRRYNEALTALDRALPPAVDLPGAIPALDEHQLPALNEAWRTLPDRPPATGIKARLAGLVWRVVAPALQRQLTFNSLLVDHLNRTAAAAREAQAAQERSMAALQQYLGTLGAYHARLVVLLQQVTPYVDTKDRKIGGGTLVLNAALSGVAEGSDKRWESVDARLEARTKALAAEQEALRSSVAVSQQAAVTLKREMERLLAGGGSVLPAAAPASGPAAAAAFAPALDAYKYVAFEDRFRGSRENIRERLETYLPLFEGASDVLDVGCGRGEFLDLLQSAGIRARGIDLNHEMAELCRARGLDVVEADAAGYLASLEDASLGGLFAAQVVEHLDPPYLLRVLDLAFQKLRPGAVMLLETLNPACWVAFFDSYIRDVTHAWPLHPDTLQYLVLASGFTRAEIEYRSPVPPEHRLQTIAVPEAADSSLLALAEAFNENVEKLNRRIFTFLDYAIVARKSS